MTETHVVLESRLTVQSEALAGEIHTSSSRLGVSEELRISRLIREER